MKKSLSPPVNSTAKTSESQHADFIRFYYAHSSVKTPKKVVDRAIAIKTEAGGTKTVEHKKIQLLNKTLPFYTEAMAYLFQLEGCTKKLFLYLLFIHLDRSTGNIRFNNSVKNEFKEFCKLFGTSYGDETIKQAIKELRDQNVLLNLKRGMDMVNPMITASNEKTRATAIREYSFQLAKDGRNVNDDFYPKYL